MPKRKAKPKTPVVTKFNVGDNVRVKHGVTELVTVPLGELEVKKGKPNRQLVADYCYWFWNHR